MAADRGGQRKVINRLGIACVQRLVGGLGTVDALRKDIAFHSPAIALVDATMNRMDLIGLGRAEAGIRRDSGAGADQAGQGCGKKQM